MTTELKLTALQGFPLIKEKDNLADFIVTALQHNGIDLQSGDLLVIAQKVVSKAEGRLVSLSTVEPSSEAYDWATKVDKDPRLVELILQESTEVVRHRKGVMIVAHRLGYVHANAGIDRSNIEGGDEQALLLPVDPDKSSRDLQDAIGQKTGICPAIIINDSAGRAWRNGITSFAIGIAGLQPLVSQVGKADLFGRDLEITEIATADELACAASVLMGQGAEGLPVVHVRGAPIVASDEGSASLIRPASEDLFR